MGDPQDAGIPLSAAQHGIWLGQRLDPASPLYLAGECIEICGAVDPAAFEAAVRQAVTEAEAMRMRFVEGAEGPRQILDESSAIYLHVIDVGAEPDAWAAVEAWARADLERPVDLGRGPLFTEALFTGPDRAFWYQSAHHIALDGFGFSLVARRVAEIYSALRDGRACDRGAFSTVRQVVEEDQAYRASPIFERDRDFWTQRFADRPRPVSLSDRISLPVRPAARRSGHLSPSTKEKLSEIARQVGASWPDVIVAVTAGYLHLLTGAHEVVVGLPVMGRLGSVSLRVPSMVMNIVPLRVPVHPGASLSDIVRNAAQEMRAIRPHLRYRYEQLRRDLKLVGGDRRLFGPVVNVMPFDYDLRFAGHRAIAHNISAGPVEDLSVAVYARSDGRGPRIDLDVNPDAYSQGELATHLRRFLDLLEAAASAPEQAIARLGIDLPVISAPSPDGGSPRPGAVLDGGPLAPEASVVDRIVEHARKQPAAVALEHGEQRLSYGELDLAARKLAARLVALGAGPGALVAVLLPRSVDAITAILGALFSGAGYLPLDPNGPRVRTAEILADARPALLITSSAYAEQVDGPIGARIVLLDEEASVPALEAPVRAGDEQLAYVIYTSGSTGRPGGVMIERSALAQFITGATRCYGLSGADRVLQFAPLHFDASVEEIFLTLCAGATLVLRTDEMLESVARLLDACAERGITVLDLPTAFWHELAYAVSTGAARLPPGVRVVIIGGEAALPERVARWRSAVGAGARLLNTYGPTEATVVATFAELSSDEAGDAGEEIPIGTPLPGVRAAVVDARGQLAPKGAVGELHLMGAGLARGYLNRPELDAARFVLLDALPERPRAYRTGDLVRERGDGQLVFVGRVDDELKISGHRVDPMEVEAALIRYPGVREAAVVGYASPRGDKRLSAFLVADDPAPSPADLRRHARSTLPAAAVPVAFVLTERLPRTSTGKIDRAALREALAASTIEPEVAPATGLEQVVLQVWREVLGVSSLSAREDFFDLGGQSLQTIQVANRLSVVLGREVPVAMVFRHPTVEGLARALEQSTSAAAVSRGLTEAMLSDAELPRDIAPVASASFAPPGVPRLLLLTGATGFVGAHLLRELLSQTDARVVCLVRADGERQAAERVRRALDRQRVSTAGLDDRVLALAADMSQPRFGLDARRFEQLAAECDAIYHNAAIVSVVRDYRSVRAVNVLGTREALRLAATRRPKPLHYVSTLAVAPDASMSPEVPEAFVPAHSGLSDGYKQSKWVAERLVQQAGERGLPVAVYRLGRVVGAPSTGVVNEQDLVFRLLRAGIPAGALPELDVAESWTPVDYVAQAIVRLSLTQQPSGTVFNVAPVPDVRLTDVFGWVSDYGYAAPLRPLPAWRALLEKQPDPELGATLAFFDLQSAPAAGDQPFGLGKVRCDHVIRGLSGTGIECPTIDRALLHRYLDACVEAGLLPRPLARR